MAINGLTGHCGSCGSNVNINVTGGGGTTPTQPQCCSFHLDMTGSSLDELAPPTAPANPPAGADAGSTVIEHYDNGTAYYTYDGTSWVYNFMATSQQGDCCTYHIDNSGTDLDEAVPPTAPSNSPANPASGSTIVEHYDNGVAYFTYDGTNWVYNFMATNQVGDCCTYHITATGDLDETTPPTAPTSPPANPTAGSTIIEHFDNGLAFWTFDGTNWVYNFMHTAPVAMAGGSTSSFTAVPTTDPTTLVTTTVITHDAGDGSPPVSTTICNDAIIGFTDEDGRDTPLNGCGRLELDRSLHVSSPSHYGGSGKIGSSHSDSDQTAVTAITTTHGRTALSASNATTSGAWSVVGGQNNVNSSAFSWVTGRNNDVSGGGRDMVWGEDNIVTGSRNGGGGDDNVISGSRNLFNGRGNNIVGGSSNQIHGTLNIINAGSNNLVGGNVNVHNQGDSSIVHGSANTNNAGTSHISSSFNSTNNYARGTILSSEGTIVNGIGLGGNSAMSTNANTIVGTNAGFSTAIASLGNINVSDTLTSGVFATQNSSIQNTTNASSTDRQFIIGGGIPGTDPHGLGFSNIVESGGGSGIIGGGNHLVNVNTGNPGDDFGSVKVGGNTSELTGQTAVGLGGRNQIIQSNSQVVTGVNNLPQGTSITGAINSNDYAFMTGNGGGYGSALAQDNAIAWTWNGRVELYNNTVAPGPTDPTKGGFYTFNGALYYQGVAGTVTMLAAS